MSYDGPPPGEMPAPTVVAPKKLRPKGWNAEVALKRATARAVKIEARRARRGLRHYPGGALQGFPASINRHTGKPHEHARAKARRLRQIGAA